MAAIILDGSELAKQNRIEMKKQVSQMIEKGVTPGLAVVLVGENPASQIYVNTKKKMCGRVGINSYEYLLDESVSEQELVDLIVNLNEDDNVDGILVQLPLPKHINENRILDTISPLKDVDGFNPVSVGRLVTGADCYLPCTPAGIIELIKLSGVSIKGKNCVVLGRSNIVGKPVSFLLLREHGTVTICHSRTVDIRSIAKNADILVAAIGIPHFVTDDMVKEGAVVIDVGINRMEDGSVTGDVDFDNVKEKAYAITPVPGGVGPMTITMLLRNTIKSALRRMD
ncbi:MAG: bifunctional methylenetetrahydrofolate dehydrogenase/methenyltetrahydrofolate cyclohydrolase FolD [Clostridia bacterium]|nr:bifunctional methylenetetrahydrofolate dehydrogenase/methenyltetrahydrofolate cyclohydrolase FolD [Clostridia bacterium]